MITLIVSAIRSLLQIFARAQTQIGGRLNSARGQINKLKQDDPTKNLPQKPPMPEMKMKVHGIEEALNELDRVQVSVESVLLPQLKSHAVSLCNDLVRHSPPLLNGTPGTGGSSSALAAGRSLIERQIKSIFKPTQSMLFGHLIMAKDFQVAGNYNWTPTSPGMVKDIANKNWNGVFERFRRKGWKPSNDMIVDAPTPQLHKRARGVGGQTIKTYYVRRKAAIEQYVRNAQKAVGTLLSGWIQARDAIGAKPADGQNVVGSGAGSGSGSARVVAARKNSSVTITNNLADPNGLLSKTGFIEMLLSKRRLALTTGVRKAVDSAVKSAVKKTKFPKIK
jgi:hypothetical protein